MQCDSTHTHEFVTLSFVCIQPVLSCPVSPFHQCPPLMVQGTGMVGVPGTASTIFSAVRDANVNVIMISQASSEHSICFAVKQMDADRTLHCLHQK